ncbi:envelope glycoprotein [Simian immunodeficiency virus]|uniref:Envelope glycoprotein gp160 n=1 Tax=Simian immunodeficiency virus TaxID=11723 RepID=E1ANU4_SIV|nr:envelope glycoprotein [Simian immunodeficiency virus]
MKCLSLIVLSSLILLALAKQKPQYVTVFYGVPVWVNSTVPMFCVTDNTNSWGTLNCIPEGGISPEVPVNVSEKFDAWENALYEQAKDNVWNLYDSTLKPCVRLSPLCVTMNCTVINGSWDGITTPAPSPAPTTPTAAKTTTKVDCPMNNETCAAVPDEDVMNCEFAVAGLKRDEKYKANDTWYSRDLWCEKDKNNNKTTKRQCFMRHCNTTSIQQFCEPKYWEPFRIRYCAPPGFALLVCKDKNYTGFDTCHNVTATSCTDMINTTVSTSFGLNGSISENRTWIYQRKQSNRTVIGLNREYNLTVECRRPSNRTVKGISLATGVFISLRVEKRPKGAWCRFYGNWTGAWEEVKKEVIKTKGYKGTNDTKKIYIRSHYGGDDEAKYFWLNCDGEFLYCKLNWFLNLLNNRTDGNINERRQAMFVPCITKMVVNDWYTVSKKVYTPPRPDALKCRATVTYLLADIDYIHTNETNVTLTAEVGDLWAAELGRYKVVEIKPIGYAPTDVKRYETRQKRVPLVLGFLGFLSAAGTAMGAAATALTVQSRHLLAGILQQQKKLLDIVEQQQHLLRLTVWGTKNLQARVTAIEKYLADQSLLNTFGCAWRQVCHTTVQWTFNATPEWNKQTWLEWERNISIIEGNISLALQEAQDQHERNVHELEKLNNWGDAFSWLRLDWWMEYLKIGVFIILGVIGLRIFFLLWGCISKIRAGYTPLLSPPPYYHQQTPIRNREEQPIKEGGEGDSGEEGGYKSPSWQRGYFYSLILRPIEILLRALWNSCNSLLSVIFQSLRSILSQIQQTLRWIIAKIQDGWQELKEFSGWLAEMAQQNAYFVWRGLCVTAQDIARWPGTVCRRIRQGFERLLI